MSIIQGYIKSFLERFGWNVTTFYPTSIQVPKDKDYTKKSLFQTIAGQFEEAGEKGEEKEKDGFTK